MIYSQDLRKKVLAFIEMGHSKYEAAHYFSVGRTTIYDWLRLKKETGSLKPRPSHRSWRKIDPKPLMGRVANHPDKHLKEHAEFFNVSIEGVRNALKRLKITRKKRHLFIKNAMKKNASIFLKH